jgi:uncharacterized protein YfbU (UPF0304 family)
MNEMKTKWRAKCSTSKNIIFFYKDLSKVDGLRATCADCTKLANILRYSKLDRKALYASEREKRLAAKKIYAKEHKDKKYATYKRFVSNNPTYHKAKAAEYNAKKLQATPAWANLSAIKQIYVTCPTGYHVDHIVPLQGKNVCGLHVEYNLQHLLAADNLRKSNKYV